MAQSQDTLNNLASRVAHYARAISSYINDHGLVAPSFAANNAAEYPQVPEVQGARLELIESLMDMLHLAIGGNEYIVTQSMVVKYDTAVINVLNQFSFFSAIPVDGSASYSEISRATLLPESIVRRILRHAMTSRLFAETAPGSNRIMHTAATAHVVRNPIVRSWIAHNMEEIEPTCGKLPDALRKFSMEKGEASEELDEAAFGLGHLDEHGKPMTMWEFLQNDGDSDKKGYRMLRLAEAMQGFSKASKLNFGTIGGGFDWASLGEATVVDVGGSSGHIAVALAQNYSNLKLIVQDLPTVKPAFRAYVPTELTSRITFQAHDFFTPQPVVAEVYFMKAVLHDWPDKYAIKVLRALLPALRHGARVILCENCLPPKYNEKGDKVMLLPVERMMTSLDLQMLVALNSKERTVHEWKSLLLLADKRFELINVATFPGTAWGLLEVVFRG